MGNMEPWDPQVTIPAIPQRTEQHAYKMGYDCIVNGANKTNCHFSLFSSPAMTAAWERGARDAKRDKKA